MGALDDAIREHLELRRKHGASDQELARKAAEALGPARREPLPAEEPLDEDSTSEAAGDATEVVEEHYEPSSALLEEHRRVEEGLESPQERLDTDAPAPLMPFDEHLAGASRPSRQAAPPVPAPGDPLATEGVPAAESLEDEDVLEETPDFLEEAPESERLWFEQKPPRDFDFDD